MRSGTPRVPSGRQVCQSMNWLLLRQLLISFSAAVLRNHREKILSSGVMKYELVIIRTTSNCWCLFIVYWRLLMFMFNRTTVENQYQSKVKTKTFVVSVIVTTTSRK